MEICALILSIISFVATIIIAILQIRTSIKINNINLNSNICEKIFDEYLISKIPFYRRQLKFNGRGVLTGGVEFNEIIVEMKKNSLYFKYHDEKFYDKLTKKLTELEDYVTLLLEKIKDSTEQSQVFNEIDNKIKEIYSIINNKKIKG